jgi:hypothetical protein
MLYLDFDVSNLEKNASQLFIVFPNSVLSLSFVIAPLIILATNGNDLARLYTAPTVPSVCPTPGIKYGANVTNVFVIVPPTLLSRLSLSKKSNLFSQESSLVNVSV